MQCCLQMSDHSNNQKVNCLDLYDLHRDTLAEVIVYFLFFFDHTAYTPFQIGNYSISTTLFTKIVALIASIHNGIVKYGVGAIISFYAHTGSTTEVGVGGWDGDCTPSASCHD